MSFSKLGQSLTAKEILDLVQDDLRKVEREISLESMASGTVVSTISQHLNGNGGKRLRPILLLLSAKLVGETDRGPQGGVDCTAGSVGGWRRRIRPGLRCCR